MRRIFSTSAAVSILMFGLASVALAETGEYENMCAMGLALQRDHENIVKTDCSINSQFDGKTYCFGKEEAKILFMKDPEGSLAKAEAHYSSKH